jgi:quercetin dioxygenase-like cupin family protein
MTEQTKKATGAIDAAVAVRLGDLVEYAPGAVVSRTLQKGAAGTLTVFAFDEGQELSEHSAPFDAYVNVLDGRVRLTIGGQPVDAAAGETVRMPADIPHAVHATTPFKMLLIMIKDKQA